MEKLVQVLAQEDTVLFIGSGISMWSGLPSWSGMIEELAQFLESTGMKADLVRMEAGKGDLLQAASYGFDKLTKQQIGEFLRSACRYGVAKPHEIHRKIVSLGPCCFVTTNYDDLIEQSLRKWRPERFFRPPVTNRHLTETAEIIHARAIDFIFKPHGDAGDGESIILTREQYRQLLPQGERQAALEALKMLLASRPVVYLGLGLRDPDFIYVRDLLANTYKGGTRDHYAIMADVSDAESDYWRRNYGIHLVSYATIECPDKTRDHSALLALLDTLLEEARIPPTVVGFDPRSPEVILALARHAAGLSRVGELSPEFRLRVHAEEEERRGSSIYLVPDKYDHYPVEKFLDEGPERALLIGLPGAGKTYSLRRAVARLAEELHEACLSEPFDEKAVVVPILADLKLYRGNLGELVSQMLPKSLPLDEVARHFKVRLFLDSFNEMPREYWESGLYESDIAGFISRIAGSSLVISSRTTDGLGKLGLPVYSLDQIDEIDVRNELERLGIAIEGRFAREVLLLLQRPFYFRYVTSGAVRLPREAHPRDFYIGLFENLRIAFATRFDGKLDIDMALSLAAYYALNQGEEAFPLGELLRTLRTSTQNAGLTDIDVRDVANWLVSSSVLIPHTSGRVAFVHQSVTEYLAASELARQYHARPSILKEKLALRRWDQALFLTLSVLPPAEANAFLQDVIEADFVLALNAVKYLEAGRDEIVSKLVSEIPKRFDRSMSFDIEIERAVEFGLPFTDAHEADLRALISCGSILGAAAVLRLVEMKGAKVKDELLQLLVECRGDYNLCCNGIARALTPFACEEDATKIAAWADSIQAKVRPGCDDDARGFISGAADFLTGLDLSAIRRAFVPQHGSTRISATRARILCDILDDHHSTAALDFAGELLLLGVDMAATSIFFIAEFAEPEDELSWDSFTAAHLARLLFIIDNTDNESWGIDALKCLCAARPDLAELVKQEATKESGIRKGALLYCSSPSDRVAIFDALRELIELTEEERQQQPLGILRHIELDWTGKVALFVRLLRLRDTTLALALFGGSCPPSATNLGNLDIGAIEWWLEWMMEVESTQDEDWDWFLNQLAALFAEHLGREVQDEFVAEFNKPNSRFRQLLLDFVLPYRSDISTEVFTEEAVSFLLRDLSQQETGVSFPGHLLGNTATEQFVKDRLLPLLRNAEQPLLQNLQAVLTEAGSRHGRRYIVE